MININNREEVLLKFECLISDAKPLFGLMTPQHMVEHLIDSVKFSNNNWRQKLYFSHEKANMIKSIVINSDKELPLGFKAPMLGDELENLKFSDLKTAIEELKMELDNFDSFFKNNEDSKTMNPTMGEFNYKEWLIFHNKHFAHHLKQFNLV